MCYSHYGNGVRNGAISIARWGLLSDCYKVNPIDQWRKILVIILGFVDTLGLDLHKSIRRFWTRHLASMSIQLPFALDRSTEAKFIDQTFGQMIDFNFGSWSQRPKKKKIFGFGRYLYVKILLTYHLGSMSMHRPFALSRPGIYWIHLWPTIWFNLQLYVWLNSLAFGRSFHVRRFWSNHIGSMSISWFRTFFRLLISMWREVYSFQGTYLRTLSLKFQKAKTKISWLCPVGCLS